MRYVTKIASVTGQKWRGVFQKLARRLAAGGSRNTESNDSGRVTTCSNMHDGYIGKSSRRRDVITTYVVDPPGVFVGMMDGVAEAAPSNPLPGMYVFKTLDRDAFNPLIKLAELKVPPVDQSPRIGTVYRMVLGEPGAFPSNAPWLARSCPAEGGGVGANYAALSIRSWTDDRKTVIGEGTTVRLAVVYLLSAPLKQLTLAASQPAWEWHIYESFASEQISGYHLVSRYKADAYITRQLPFGASARAGSRMVTCGLMTTNPKQAGAGGWTHRGGDVAIFVKCAFVVGARDLPAVDILSVQLKDMSLNRIEPEPWDAGLPWVQEYIDNAADPPEKVKISYPPLGTYLSQEEPGPVSDMLSNAFGLVTACIKDESAEFLVDLRVARTWVDERGLDKYPELRPITIQVQTALVLITVHGFDLPESLRTLSFSLVAQDVSGYPENGCYRAYGGSDESVHRLWRPLWSGNAGGRHVALVSVVRHARREEAAPGVDWLKTSQSSFSGRTELAEEPVAFQLYVDGALTEHISSETGFSFLSSLDEESLRLDDYYWPYQTSKVGTVVGKDIVFFTAYSYPNPSQIILARWDIDAGVLSVIRRISSMINGKPVRAALSCWQEQILDDDGKEISPGCLILRVGAQDGPGWLEITKDYGESWVRIFGPGDGAPFTPAMGAYYMGSEFSASNYGEIFKAKS